MRLVGDARKTNLYAFSINQKRAQELADEVCSRFFPGRTVRIVFNGHIHNKRRHGFYKRGKITIAVPSWGVLGHELAHIETRKYGTRKHGATFKAWHSIILDFLEYYKGLYDAASIF